MWQGGAELSSIVYAVSRASGRGFVALDECQFKRKAIARAVPEDVAVKMPGATGNRLCVAGGRRADRVSAR